MMKKNDLIKIIELVVRKEVKKQMNEIFIKENKSSLKSLTPKKQVVKKKAVQKKPVQYTENKALNEVLNETVALSKGDEMDEYPTMGGGVFDSSRASELLGYGESMAAGGDKETQRNMIAAQTLREKNVNVNDVPESLVNALTRDYSDLMKHDKFKSKK
tara:strand:- start:12443 stop:12919 length:477 start_codon:yes stop_codon:yes gene_type:complete